MSYSRITSSVAALLCVVCFAGADWRQFRGNDVNGVAGDTAPTKWDAPAWTVDLTGRGLSAPIIIGDNAAGMLPYLNALHPIRLAVKESDVELALSILESNSQSGG